MALLSRFASSWLNSLRGSVGHTTATDHGSRRTQDWSVEERLTYYSAGHRSNWTLLASYAQGTVAEALFPVLPSPLTDSFAIPERLRVRGRTGAVGVFGQWVSSRFTLSPSLTLQRTDSSGTGSTDSLVAGLNAHFRLHPNWSLSVNVSEGLTAGGLPTDHLRRDGFSISLRRYFDSPKAAFLWGYKPRGRLRGVVFEDANFNGMRDAGEKGFAGVPMQLSTGVTTVTDALGTYEFRDIPLGRQEVIVGTQGFAGAVHFTTPTRMPVALDSARAMEINFGLNNLSHLLVIFFNDYRLDGQRYAETPGVAGIEVELTGGGITRSARSGIDGRTQFRELSPGQYRLTVKIESLPPDFVIWEGGKTVALGPAQILNVALPLQALRAVRGTVFHDLNGNGVQDPGEPGLPGVWVAANGLRVETDALGKFLLTGLPAGTIEISLQPARSLTEELRSLLVPVVVELSKDPEVRSGLSFALSSPRLIEALRR